MTCITRKHLINISFASDVISCELTHFINSDKISLEFHFENNIIHATADDTWDCLRNLQNESIKFNINLLCAGLTENIHPSRMSRQMGDGSKAYILKLGFPATKNDLISIFEIVDKSQIVSKEKQDIFYKKWLSSLN